ncbi:DUF3566 domain-containing protein [Saccharothrix algeriensis]|uniref:DUF3566 domain-containing protein n=1 Tax=Saccharothrix algeriensis TaxID=173560 RepID=A0A8T8I5W3_9PSEU|nr:DUF3566 domain-containing protein [Saccharothrix algeriensis]MBM7812169.1 hypothetical protein [Saccharothrix algeriensis]QTR05810.1 DUF3566 domain-containing protein [Saccharothrix algeriensis]
MTSPEKPEDKTAVITRPGAESTPEQPTAQTSSGADAAVEPEPSAAPPPWQRVSSDAGYGEAQQVGPGDPAPEQPAGEAGAQPAYPASDPDTVAVARPVVGAGSGGEQQAGSSRTSVNLGAANGRTGAASSPRRPGRGPRRASLQVKRVDPWSVLKLALVLSVALFFVWLVAVGVLYGVLNGMGVWDKINNTANDLLQGNESAGDPLISAGRVFGVAAIVGAVNIVLFTALATVGAFVYNVSADLAGGLEVTLSERE